MPKNIPIQDKAAAVALGNAIGDTRAAEQLGVSERSIRNWRKVPAIVELAVPAGPSLAEGAKELATLALHQLIEQVKAGKVKGKNLAVLFGISTEKALLLAGHPTQRTEVQQRTWLDELDERERRALRDAIDAELERRPDPPEPPRLESRVLDTWEPGLVQQGRPMVNVTPEPSYAPTEPPSERWADWDALEAVQREKDRA